MSWNTTLLDKYTFWLFEKVKHENKDAQSTLNKQATDAFNQNLNPIQTFSTIAQFWEIFLHMKKPNTFEDQTDVYLFREGIKPLWEDPRNQKGGYYTIKLDKAHSNKVWQNLVLAFVAPIKSVMSCVNGVRIKAKQQLITMQIWMNASAQQNANQLKQYLKDCLQITDEKVFMFFLFDFHLKKVNKIGFKDNKDKPPINREKKGGSFYSKKRN